MNTRTIDTTAGQYTARLEVWDDWNCERPGFYRLYWANVDGSGGCPAIGYCSPGGSYRTIRAAVADGLRRFGETAIRARR